MNSVTAFSLWPTPVKWVRCCCNTPPAFTTENLEKVQSTLRKFYDYSKVVELRHKSWSENNEQLKALLTENRASDVLIDEPKFATSIRQNWSPGGEIFYFRAHGRNS